MLAMFWLCSVQCSQWTLKKCPKPPLTPTWEDSPSLASANHARWLPRNIFTGLFPLRHNSWVRHWCEVITQKENFGASPQQRTQEHKNNSCDGLLREHSIVRVALEEDLNREFPAISIRLLFCRYYSFPRQNEILTANKEQDCEGEGTTLTKTIAIPDLLSYFYQTKWIPEAK